MTNYYTINRSGVIVFVCKADCIEEAAHIITTLSSYDKGAFLFSEEQIRGILVGFAKSKGHNKEHARQLVASIPTT